MNMLVLKTEAYQERYAHNYTEFMFDTDLGSGTPYYLDEMQKSLKNMEGHISLISSDIKEIIDEYGISDKYPQDLNHTIDKINWSYDVLKTTLDQIIRTMEETLQDLNSQSKVSLDQIETINEKLGIKTETPATSESNKSILATAGTGALSVVEGFGQYGEELWNTGVVASTIVATPVMWCLDKYQEHKLAGTNYKWEPMVDSMWNETTDYIKQGNNKWMYDTFYDNTQAGNYLKDSTYNFQATRGTGNLVGFAVPTALTVYGTYSSAMAASTAARASSAKAAGWAFYRAPSPAPKLIAAGEVAGLTLVGSNLTSAGEPDRREYYSSFKPHEIYLEPLTYDTAVAQYQAIIEIEPKQDAVSSNEVSENKVQPPKPSTITKDENGMLIK